MVVLIKRWDDVACWLSCALCRNQVVIIGKRTEQGYTRDHQTPDMQEGVGEDLISKSRMSTQQITNPPSVACVRSGAPHVSLYTEQLLSVLVTDTERTEGRAGSGRQSTSPRPAPSPPGTLVPWGCHIPYGQLSAKLHYVIMSSWVTNRQTTSGSTGLLRRQ